MAKICCRCWKRSCPNYGRRRFYLNRRPEQYILKRFSACPQCGSQLTPTNHRNSGREKGREGCSCDGYAGKFGLGAVHRRGSLHCIYGKAGAAGFTWEAANSREFDEWRAAQ